MQPDQGQLGRPGRAALRRAHRRHGSRQLICRFAAAAAAGAGVRVADGRNELRGGVRERGGGARRAQAHAARRRGQRGVADAEPRGGGGGAVLGGGGGADCLATRRRRRADGDAAGGVEVKGLGRMQTAWVSAGGAAD